MRFTQRLLEQIGLPPNADLIPDRPPFELDVADRRLEWTEVEAPSGRNGGFSGGFTAEGLRAELHARGFEGSSAIELAGTVRNEGSTTFSVTAASTLYLKVRVADDWDDPVVRSWAGAPLAYPIFFPPDDYRPIDRQLVSMPFIWTPLWIKGSPTGFSSHESLPFAIVAGKGRGVAIGVEWSGTWYLAAQPDSGQTADRHLNLELDVGVWSIPLQLRPGDALPLANVLLVPYQGNATAGGNALRRHIRNHVVPRLDGKEVAPPTSFNTGFALGWADNISDSLLRPAVDAAAEVGIEYFVVDAGWHEGGCPLGTGNWEEINRANFPDGLEPFSAYVQSKGMQYGMWFDPETAEAASGMFRRHPDWFFPKPAPGPTTFTHRRVMKHVELMADAAEADRRMLDFGLPEVQQWWIDYLTAAYERWGLRWIRWDFTDDAPFLHWQAAGEPGWAQIRHVLGVYRVWDELRKGLPDLFFEQCAGGGHRLDLGTVRRGHAFWMSDHTVHSDIVRRLQTRLNQVIPGNYGNTNVCQFRDDYSDYDFLSHGCGPLGYSGRLWESPPDARRRLADALARFKSYRHLLLGDYTCELADHDDRHGHEVHRWQDGGQELVLEFNADGPETASMTLS